MKLEKGVTYTDSEFPYRLREVQVGKNADKSADEIRVIIHNYYLNEERAKVEIRGVGKASSEESATILALKNFNSEMNKMADKPGFELNWK